MRIPDVDALGCMCRLAANGFDALESIAQDLYNEVLMDCRMLRDELKKGGA